MHYMAVAYGGWGCHLPIHKFATVNAQCASQASQYSHDTIALTIPHPKDVTRELDS